MITTSLGVNGADVGPSSPQQNNALKGVAAQWGLFSSAGDVSSIAARCAGMLSRWHGARERERESEQTPGRPLSSEVPTSPQAEKAPVGTCVATTATDCYSGVSLGISVWRCHLAPD